MAAPNSSIDIPLLNLLAPLPDDASKHTKFSDLDPLMLAAVAASGPHITRNHYHHDFFPDLPPETDHKEPGPKRLTYVTVSRQAPRRQRLAQSFVSDGKENQHSRVLDPLKSAANLPSSSGAKKRRASTVSTDPAEQEVPVKLRTPDPPVPAHELKVKCMARTRIPTPHGLAFLHLYHNTKDDKEHMAVVIDPAQLEENAPMAPPSIRSRSLDAVWNENETDMDRITRGAYVGRLSPHSTATPSHPAKREQNLTGSTDDVPSPLIRIHSECFTGETIGSMRCDCGEQLDEAIRLISQPIQLPSHASGAPSRTIPGRGAIIYLRQEGRGIGLLSKIRAYNLQDLGHDTVTANLMLGHKADERGYEIAAAILQDLELGSEVGEGVRLLTNNPDKVQALEKAGVRIVERVPMIPRSWRSRMDDAPPGDEHEDTRGATLIGGKAVHGEDLDKYLRTKVLRMGHMLPLGLSHPVGQ